MHTWKLEDAKAKLSEVVRRAHEEGPQRITIRGKNAAVVLSAAEYETLIAADKPNTLYEALRACPYPEDLIANIPPRVRMAWPVSPIEPIE